MTAIVESPGSEILNKRSELEGMEISKEEYSRNDEIFEYFEKYSWKISFDGGYITAPFPLKQNIGDLADNYSVAWKILIALQAYFFGCRSHTKTYVDFYG